MKKLFHKIPDEIKYLVGNLLIVYLFLLLFRVIFYIFFFKTNDHHLHDILKAWHLGIKFDMRLALIISIPILLVILFFQKRIFSKRIFHRIFMTYFFIVYLVLLVIYVVDLGFYAYMGQRINLTILNFVNWRDAGTNLGMVWESYPIVRGLIGVIILMFILYFLHKRLYLHFYQKNNNTERHHVTGNRKRYFGIYVTIIILLMAYGIYGNFDYYPLQWGQALFTQDNGISSLGLNPVLNFYNKLKFGGDTYHPALTRKYYPYVAKYLHITHPDSANLNFVRTYEGDTSRPKPNIVFVMLESTGAAVSSMFNNPMHPTPNMQRLADSGVLFENFYVPAHSTAKTVYALITGLPDITLDRPAASHSSMINQRVIMNEFNGYEKYYFLGGNMNWENIRALFTTNIRGVRLFEEKDFSDKRLDVWGISDYDLVHEANKVFDATWRNHKPFVAFLQLADNHEPFSTTPGAGDFKLLTKADISKSKFDSSGFSSLGELNALRYEDYNVGQLIKLAKESGYLDNTIFVFFGDHNAILNPYHFMPIPEYEMGTGQLHVTAFIYSPYYFKPARMTKPASLLDLFPTFAHYIGMPFKNYTLGVNLFDSTRKQTYNFLFFIKNSKVYYGMIGSRFLYEISVDHKDSSLYDLSKNPLKNVANLYPDTARCLNALTNGFYQSTWYLIFNNKNDSVIK
jgi:phosphoglycerol transferase MdoB-like AlkP superfamily enzyme